MNRSALKICILVGATSGGPVVAQQISIGRVEAMPNVPEPYIMRDWKAVALSYDSLVFDHNQAGQFLPFIWEITNTVNYPGHVSFGLPSVVGTTFPGSAEAITCLPAVIGASLVGIDKRSQNGKNWVLMCEEWFNNRPAESVYLNHPTATSGDDWWYDTVPNVFFYQLYDLYRGTGDFPRQFKSVADRWLQALKAMNGSVVPWSTPNLYHRGWRLSSMTPNDNGVREPEAAGALAWLLYNAYRETGRAEYRYGSEWAMEFLDNESINPSYELQLAFGVLTAARMNAELGTTYNVEKMINWCFDVGPLRDWGAIVGTWGGYDCSGLVGEVNGVDDYAFAMNTFQQIGALVPVVRYDERFARAIGKWVLNAANAARLFYPSFLPDVNQDNEAWAQQHDPSSSIGYEALRQFNGAVSPYATGDAISGGWGATNLALYSSSHVGIVGGIIDTTDVPGILRLDALKTDYFHAAAYPTYLFFNPHADSKSINLNVGSSLTDVYETLSNTFIHTNVADTVVLDIPADSPLLIVLAPAGGMITYERDRTLIDGVIVDHSSGRPIAGYPPRIKALAASRDTIRLEESVRLYCTATDRDQSPVTYAWAVAGGAYTEGGAEFLWTAPDAAGAYIIRCRVSDGLLPPVEDSVAILVVASVNNAPAIHSLSARPGKIDLGGTSVLTCVATDVDGDSLQYDWSSPAGVISGRDSTVSWQAPTVAGNYGVVCTVRDSRGGSSTDSIGIVVRDFSAAQSGSLIASYPFSGNANDASGNGNDGVVLGATLVSDLWGQSGDAYSFDGIDDAIQVPNSPGLNVTTAISVSWWMNVGGSFEREAYVLSHGNWENRWKVSIANSRIRWTVKTESGIKDLDSRSVVETGSTHHIVVLYGGEDFEIYLDGELDAFSSWSGALLATSIDLMIGQDLPGNSQYNFMGVIDEVRLYDYALSIPEIQNLSRVPTSVRDAGIAASPQGYGLRQNHPNPFNPTTIIRFRLQDGGVVFVRVFDFAGREISTLVSEYRPPGEHSVLFDAVNLSSGVYYVRLTTPGYSQTRAMLLLR